MLKEIYVIDIGVEQTRAPLWLNKSHSEIGSLQISYSHVARGYYY